MRSAFAWRSAPTAGMCLAWCRAALTQLGLGLAIGIPAALVGGLLLGNQLYGIKSYDPIILGLAILALAGCAMFAAFVPARRASRVDPIVALRYELDEELRAYQEMAAEEKPITFPVGVRQR